MAIGGATVSPGLNRAAWTSKASAAESQLFGSCEVLCIS